MSDSIPCQCGCGEIAPVGKQFIRGHWSRTPEAKAMYQARRVKIDPPNPSGLCMCGCGEVTPVATKTKLDRLELRGHHLRYIHGHHMRGKKGSTHPRWNGGRYQHKSGYIYVSAQDHPRANADGYVLEHRLVVEATLGRLLEPFEVVHHINGIRNDNRPENLIAIPSHAGHIAIHQPLEHWRETVTPEDLSKINRDNGRKGLESRWGKH